MENEWHDWINSNILMNSDELGGDFVSVKDYFNQLFKSIIVPRLKRKKIVLIYDDINMIVERALNVYFWMWIAFNKNRSHPYLSKSHSLNNIYHIQNIDILEYLELQLFPDEFWDNIKKLYAVGNFSPDLSDFGQVFWDSVPVFIFGHISLENSVGLDNFYTNNHEKMNIEVRNDLDSYVADYVSNCQFP